MKLLFSYLIFSVVFTSTFYSQCGGDIDLNTWTQEGPIASSSWSVNPGGNSVTQSVNSQPGFFVSPDNFINVKIRGKFEVNTTADDDIIGLVFGYETPNSLTTTGECKFNLFDWKKLEQTVRKNVPPFPNLLSQEGFALSQVDTTLSLGLVDQDENLGVF